MSIQDKIFEMYNTPICRYRGIPTNIFSLPVFKDCKKNSIHHALARMEKKLYLVFTGSYWKLSQKGDKYLKRRSARFQTFASPFTEESIKNLLIIFDIPEVRKAEREWLRFHLRKFGYEMIQRSSWVGPSPLPKEFLNYLQYIKLADCIKKFKLAKGYIDNLKKNKNI